MDLSGQGPPSKKSGKSVGSMDAKVSSTSLSMEKTPERSRGEKKKLKSSNPASPAGETPPRHVVPVKRRTSKSSDIIKPPPGETPPGLVGTEKRRHSKSSGSIPATEGKEEEQPRDAKESTLPKEKEAAATGTGKPSLVTLESASGKPVTLKTSASAAEPAAVDFGGGSSGLNSVGWNVAKALLFPTEVLLLFVLVMAFAFFVGELMRGPPVPMIAGKLTCPEEWHALHHALDGTVKPCENFYGHVCSKIDAGNPTPFSPLMKGAVTAALANFAEMTFHTSDAGMLSAALHETSVDTTPSPESGLVDYVRAIMREGAVNTQLPMTALQLVRFFAKLSLKYKLPAVVSFTVSGTLLSLERNDGCFLEHGIKSLMDGSELGAINEVLHTNVTLHELKRIEEELGKIRDTGDSFIEQNGIANSSFSDLPDEDWRGMLEEFLFPAYPDIVYVQQRRGDRLGQVIRNLAKGPRHSHALAYAVICTAMRTRRGVDQALAQSSPPLEMPVFQALDIGELEEAVIAEATSAHCRDKYILRLFDRLRDMVPKVAEKSVLLNGTSKAAFSRILANVSVAFPRRMVAPHVNVPKVSDSFAANLLAARSYAFDVRRRKVSLNIPGRENLFSRSALRRQNVIYLPTYLYTLIPQHCEPKANDFPAVGMEFAFHLWSYLLEQFWPEERWRMEPHLECFRKTHGNASGDEGYRRIASASLALATLFDVMLPQKRQQKLMVNGAQASVDRFAFLIWMFDRCSFLPEWLKPEDVNLVLKNVGTFSAAFDCPKLDRCLVN